METRKAILELRKSRGLTQAEFAQALAVTRQAVSRWETGDTIPSTDTLKLIAKAFDVPADYLLGDPAGQCQSCGMMLVQDGDKGTESDGSRSETYCASCFQKGAFTKDITMEEMARLNLQALDEWNASMGLRLTEQEAKAQLLEFLPTLKRWRKP